MNIVDKVKVILAETFSSPSKNSFVTTVAGTKVVLREGGNYRGINLRGADLTGAHLDKINLEGADLSETILSGATFRNANIKNVKTEGAIVSGTDFSGAITGAGFRGLRGVRAVIKPVGIKIIEGKK